MSLLSTTLRKVTKVNNKIKELIDTFDACPGAGVEDKRMGIIVIHR
jgi:hypothetical protein